MNKKDLLELGIEDEDLAQKIIILHGKDIEKMKMELLQLKEDADGLKEQLKEADEVIEGFKKMDVEGIKAAADEWKQKAEEAKQQAEEKIKSIKFEHLLETGIAESKARNVKAAKALLNMENLKLSEDGASVIGLEDQLKVLAEEHDYLFESEQPTPKFSSQTQKKQITEDSIVAIARQAAGLTDD